MSAGRSFRLCLLLTALTLSSLPTAAQAETRTFFDFTPLYPTGGAGGVGPANPYPSSIAVSGVPGTVTGVTATLIGFGGSNPDDTDVLLTGPNGQAVMLMSDSCGLTEMRNNNWTFDDSAETFVSNNGPCLSFQVASFKPSNYVGAAPEPDDMSPGPPPPYVNALSFLTGGTPNGAWNLYLLDDSAANGSGFNTAGWMLTLEVLPPVVPQPTGQRAAALKKCKKKRGKARKKCKRKALLLPV